MPAGHHANLSPALPDAAFQPLQFARSCGMREMADRIVWPTPDALVMTRRATAMTPCLRSEPFQPVRHNPSSAVSEARMDRVNWPAPAALIVTRRATELPRALRGEPSQPLG